MSLLPRSKDSLLTNGSVQGRKEERQQKGRMCNLATGDKSLAVSHLALGKEKLLLLYVFKECGSLLAALKIISHRPIIPYQCRLFIFVNLDVLKLCNCFTVMSRSLEPVSITSYFAVKMRNRRNDLLNKEMEYAGGKQSLDNSNGLESQYLV